ncbi:MAG: CPBP family glutamic-type intramembrane protease [Candidatus Bathyarchaeia archaeon]
MKLLILFNVVTLLVAVHYLLLTFDTPMFATTLFYIIMWIVSTVMLIWMRIYYGETKWLDYDEEPTREHVTSWLGGLAGVIAAAAVVPRIIEQVVFTSVIYVPSPKRMLAATPFDMWSLMSDVLFNICLVALAEETMKTASHIALYNSTKNEWISILVPVGVWAILHGYTAYVGALQFPLIAAAFTAGVIIFFVQKHTRSLLAATLLHGAYNSIILLLRFFLW